MPIFEELGKLFLHYKNPNIITISNNQRKPAPKVNYLATVYNGVDLNEFEFCDKPNDYFLFVSDVGFNFIFYLFFIVEVRGITKNYSTALYFHKD